jgi:hypothetical protein
MRTAFSKVYLTLAVQDFFLQCASLSTTLKRESQHTFLTQKNHFGLAEIS